MTLLVTGATGWLGLHVVERLAGRRRMLLLVRRGEHASAFERMQSLLRGAARAALDDGSITVLERDLAEDLGALPGSLSGVVHLAARTDFGSRDVADYRPTNVDGALRAAALAARAGCPLVLASTAYVAGDHAGLFRERDVDLGQSPNNAYEQSKLEAEQHVRAFAEEHGVPLTVVRPGIVLPERPRAGLATGPGPLVHLEVLAGLEGRGDDRERTLRLEADPEGRLNLVPLELVVRALVESIARPAPGERTFHLTAPRSFRMREVQGAVNACLQGLRVSFVETLEDPDRYERLLARRSAVYRPYYGLRGRFDRAQLERAFRIDVPADAAWLRRVFEQHLEDWRAAACEAEASARPERAPAAVDEVRAYFAGFLAPKCGRNLVPGLETLCADFTVSVPGAGSQRLTIVDGRLTRVEPAAQPSRNYDYSVAAADFLAVARAEARPSELFFERRVHVRGDLFHALATATALEDFFRLYPYGAATRRERIA